MDYVLKSFKGAEVRIILVNDVELTGTLKFDMSAPFIEIETMYGKKRAYFNPAQIIYVFELN